MRTAFERLLLLGLFPSVCQSSRRTYRALLGQSRARTMYLLRQKPPSDDTVPPLLCKNNNEVSPVQNNANVSQIKAMLVVPGKRGSTLESVHATGSCRAGANGCTRILLRPGWVEVIVGGTAPTLPCESEEIYTISWVLSGSVSVSTGGISPNGVC